MLKINPLDHPICLAMPSRLTPASAWHEHIPFGMLLVDLLRPNMIVELGTQYGDSYCAFCQAVKELKLNTSCYAVDTWQGDPHSGLYGPEILADLREHHDPLYSSFSRLIQSTFDEALEHFAVGTVDLLHIDGYHTYQSVKHDFESWLPKMSQRGVVLFHDTNVRERDFGIRRFWDEIKLKYPYFEFLHGHGLGILAVGKMRSREFQELFQLPEEYMTRIRDFFFQLGHQLTIRVRDEASASELESQKGQLQALQADLESIDARIADLETNLQDKIARIADLETSLKEKTSQISSLEASLQEKTSQIADLETSLKALLESKDQQIIDLAKEIKSKGMEILSRDQQITNLQSKLNEINNSVTWRTARKLHRIIDRILPLGSKRRFLAKRILINLAHPGRLIKNLNPINLIRYFRYLNKIGADRLESVVSPAFPTQSVAVVQRRKMDVPDPQKLTSLDKLSDIEFAACTNPLVSIIIPVFNQWQYTYTCLKSIRDNTEGVDYEVIIADDHSTDLTADMLTKIKNIEIVRGDTNLGFIRNCNNASAHARGKYLLFLNNDTYVMPEWLKALVSPLENDEKTGIVGAKLLYKDGSLQEAGCIVWDDPFNIAHNYGRSQDPDNYEFNFLREVDYCSGCCLLVREHIFRSLKGFNNCYLPAYSEDTDLCFAARELGYKTIYQPECEIVHYEGISHGWDWESPARRRMKENQQLFYKKWEAVIKQDNFALLNDTFLARDRSRYRKHVVVIESQVPTWDRDAGSLTIYSYLKLLVKLGFRVTFIPHNLMNPMPYTLELQRMGIEVVYGNFNFDNWIQANGKYIDIALLARPEISIMYIDKVRRFSKAIILYYVHDLHYLRERRRYEIEKDKKILMESERLREKEFAIFSKSDVIMTPSIVEAEILRNELPGSKIEVIPAYIYEDGISTIQAPSFRERRGLIYLGGFLHTPNIDAVQWFVKEVFPLVLERLPDIKLTIAGSDPTDSIKALACDNITITGYVKELGPLFDKARVFVSPLRYGAGLKGKIVTSLYYGLPVVTTSIGNEGLGLRDGKQAMVADDAKGFAEKIVRLYTDEKLWQDMSRSGRELVKDRFSMRAARDKFLSIVNLQLCDKCNKLFASPDRTTGRNGIPATTCDSCRSSLRTGNIK